MNTKEFEDVTLATITLEEYHQIVEVGIWDDRKVELLNGVLVEMTPEGIPHAYGISSTSDYLRSILGERVQVREGHPITIPAIGSEPEPDIAIVRRSKVWYADHHPYPEDIYWLIEYSDSSIRKDLGVKASIYAAAGVPEYWVVNLQKNILLVFRSPVNGNYESIQKLTSGVIRTLSFPDIEIQVSQILS